MSKAAKTLSLFLEERTGSQAERAMKQPCKWLLDYELRAATRYRRFASLVFLSTYDRDVDLHTILRCCGRGSDEMFVADPDAAVLMGDTDKEQAMAAIVRYTLAAAGVDLRFGIVAFPIDARQPAELHAIGRSRLEVARQGGYGAVVDTGVASRNDTHQKERR